MSYGCLCRHIELSAKKKMMPGNCYCWSHCIKKDEFNGFMFYWDTDPQNMVSNKGQICSLLDFVD